MKNFLGGILDREERIAAQPGFLRPIDTKGLARKLDIDTAAQVNGQNEKPESNAGEHDAKEKEIIQYLLSEYHWQVDHFYTQLRAYSNRLTKFSIQAEFHKLKLIAQDTSKRLEAASVQAEADLGPKFSLFKERKQELDDFRKKHGLARPARDSSGVVYTIGLLLFLVSFESVLNGFFFSKGSDFGLLGGIGTAIGISLVNVAVAFLMGLGPARWLLHRNWLLKLLSLLILIAYLAGTLGLQTFAAHFRDASAHSDGAEAFSGAVDSLLTNPFRLEDINSYYLVGLGLLFSLLAFLKGLYQDDPYPGYGALWRRFTKARDEYSDEHAALFDTLEDAKDECVDSINSGISKLPKYPQTAADIIIQRTAIVGKFKAYEVGLSDAVNELLTRYRERNKDHRKTAPPAYFSDSWKLVERATESAEATALLAVKSDEKTDVGGPLAELNGQAEAVLKQYGALVARYPHPTRLIDE